MLVVGAGVVGGLLLYRHRKKRAAKRGDVEIGDLAKHQSQQHLSSAAASHGSFQQSSTREEDGMCAGGDLCLESVT